MNAYRFPTLASLAKTVLCVPATSVPSERLFSGAGYIVNKLRSSLDKANVNMLVCLRKWMSNLIEVSTEVCNNLRYSLCVDNLREKRNNTVTQSTRRILLFSAAQGPQHTTKLTKINYQLIVNYYKVNY